jgi:hypothetical protein
MRSLSTANLAHVLDHIETLTLKRLGRLRKAEALVETLFTFQVPSRRLKLEDTPPGLLANGRDSDKLLDNLLDPCELRGNDLSGKHFN